MFKYAIGETVILESSDEVGTIVGRAEYSTSEPAYYVRYRDGSNCQVEKWWNESSIGGKRVDV